MVALGVLAPYAQLRIGRILFIYPIIAVAVIGGQVGKAISALGVEQFIAAVYGAVAILVQREKVTV